jgi:hypothetical protein
MEAGSTIHGGLFENEPIARSGGPLAVPESTESGATGGKQKVSSATKEHAKLQPKKKKAKAE